MRTALALGLALLVAPFAARAGEPPRLKLADGWKAELVVQAPDVLYPTAIVAAPDGTLYVGQDPMDMPGPPTEPIDSVLAIRPDGMRTVFADGLWAVMGLEWADGALFVVHAPFLSAFRDTDGDGRADRRVDLVTGLGPERPGASGLNDHVAAGLRLGMDGFLYIAVGDKGIPRGVGQDGTTIELAGGGVVRVRPDGTNLQIVSTGERNPLSVALNAAGEVFTLGNDDDSKRWPNSLTHHIAGGHYGYPYEFLLAPSRCLPIVAGWLGGAGAQGLCYEEDGLPDDYRGDLFFCDWGLQSVFRLKLERAGGTFALKSRTTLVERGEFDDFRPFSLTVGADRSSLYLSDWAFHGWRARGPKTGRIFRLSYEGPDRVATRPVRIGATLTDQLAALDHPARSIRLEAQRRLAEGGLDRVPALAETLRAGGGAVGRVHALWALDAIPTPEARTAVRSALSDSNAAVRLQAARVAGIRRDGQVVTKLGLMLDDADPAVRREAAIALGAIGDPSSSLILMSHLGEPDAFAAWSIRRAIRSLDAWDAAALVAALTDPKRRDNALKLTDEAWALPVVEALVTALPQAQDEATRAEIVGNLGGLYRRHGSWSGQWYGPNPLAGPLPPKNREWSPEGMARVLVGLARGLGDDAPAVRRRAVAGLRLAGPAAAPYLRARLEVERDDACALALAESLGQLGDAAAVAGLARCLKDPGRSLATRQAALDALGRINSPPALRARFALLFDPAAPPELVARALPALARAKVLPMNDVAGFLDHRAAVVRASAVQALAASPRFPAALGPAIVARLEDDAVEVRRAALAAVRELKIAEAVPRLLPLAQAGPLQAEATLALAAMPDPRAVPAYLGALASRNPELRRAGESALNALRDQVAPALDAEAKSGRLSPAAAEAVERILTRFRPIVDWRVLGPVPGSNSDDLLTGKITDPSLARASADGRPLAWQPRQADPATGRLNLTELQGGPKPIRSDDDPPDLGMFGVAEVVSERERPAVLLVGSSGSVAVSLNERVVLNVESRAGRPFEPDSDRVRVWLRAGRNRLRVRSAPGIGAWAFGVQVSEPAPSLIQPTAGRSGPAALRAYALEHEGDPGRGADLFFGSTGLQCARCHAAGGRGSAQVGPDLSGLAGLYDRAEVIRSVLEPSRRIAPGYEPALVAKADGQVLCGLIQAETDAYLDLIDADARVRRIPKSEIAERRVGDRSLMPEGLADPLAPEEFADLIAYLMSLKPANPGR